MDNSLLHAIALTMIPGIGCMTAKKLIAYTGSVEGVLKEKKSNLLKIPGIGEYVADEILKSEVMTKAEAELAFIDKYNIKAWFYLDDNYPARLKHCPDSPVVLYSKGNCNLDSPKMISIVGTRKATDYGKAFCEKLIFTLAERKHDVVIISGLAFGIDITSHKAAIKAGLPTIAVIGHGMKTVYPAEHDKYAREIAKNGALVTEYTSDTKADRALFVRRNRIIAGLSDAVIVVETGKKGGALATAEFANSYNRDVFALPGRIDDNHSQGCNMLIKQNKAALIESAEDIEYLLGWASENENKPKVIQRNLFVELTEEEKVVMDVLNRHDSAHIDIIGVESEMPVSKVSSMLLKLEFDGMVRSLPGKIYRKV
ncbi:MAG TPA: DNA-processing protein DprA [Bacteroidales bacterium]|nr:DNA-processing protein DprA [Bacteroidales bacterium]